MSSPFAAADAAATLAAVLLMSLLDTRHAAMPPRHMLAAMLAAMLD